MQPWYMEFRPFRWNEIVGNGQVIKSIKSNIQGEQYQHILLHGPPGTGKTCIAEAIAYEMHGKNYKKAFTEFNASDKRKLDDVRGDIKRYMSTMSVLGKKKILLLDEADGLTKDAQNALRRPLEQYADNCMVIFTCNNFSKMNDAIVSRCKVYQLRRISRGDLGQIEYRIMKLTKLEMSDDAYEKAIDISGGDARKLINTLQSVHSLGRKVEVDDIDVADKLDNAQLDQFWDYIIRKQPHNARPILYEGIYVDGIQVSTFLERLHMRLIKRPIEDIKKAKMIEAMGLIDSRISYGSTVNIQLDTLIAMLIRI